MARRFKSFIVCFVLVALYFGSVSPASLSQTANPTNPPASFENPVGFIENKGQWSKELCFIGKTPFGKIGFGQSSIYLQVQGINNNQSKTLETIKITLDGSNPVSPLGLDPYATNYYFYIGRDQSRWAKNVKMYRSIQFPDVYPGIDLFYKMEGKRPKYEFHVKPGANPSLIKLTVEGASLLNHKDTLEYVTPRSLMKDGGLYVFEKESRHPVEASFRTINNHTYGFEIHSYDTKQVLVIDPILFEVNLGGDSFYNEARAMVLDESRNIYLTGYTMSFDFPTTPGAFIPFPPSNFGESVFVSKLDPSGTSLVFSLLISGTSTFTNFGSAIAINSDNHIVIAGTTGSYDFPVSSNAYQSMLRGSTDFFVSEFDETGSQLVYSTLIGGNGSEMFSISGTMGYGHYIDIKSRNPILLDANNTIFIGGITDSFDFPLTPGNLKGSSISQSRQIILFRISRDCSTLLYSTYFGGSSDEGCLALVQDQENHIYISGYTSSMDFTLTSSAFQMYKNSLSWSGFITGFYSDPLTHQLTLNSSTFLGDDDSVITAIDLTRDQHIAVTGITYSYSFPTTPGAFMTYRPDQYGYSDIFISVLDSTLSILRYSTYMGGADEDYSVALDVDRSDYIYITGSTWSNDFPVTNDAFRSSISGYIDLFILRIDPTLSFLNFSTFYGYGGTGSYANDIYVTPDNIAYYLGTALLGGGYLPGIAQSFGDVDLPPPPSVGQFIVIYKLTIPYIFPPNPVLSLSASHNTFTLDWTALAGQNPLDGFVLYRSVDGSPFTYFDDFGPATLETIDNDIAPGMTYAYYLESYDDEGNYSGPSNIVSYTKPAKPLNCKALSSEGAVVLSWDHSVPGSFPIGQYLVFRSEDALFSSPILASNVSPLNNFYKDTNVVIGKTYYYKVMAQDTNTIDSFLSDMVNGFAKASIPQLALSIIINKTEFEKGEAVILKVYVHSLGNVQASNVVLTMTLPEELEFTSVDSGFSSTVSGQTVTFPMGNIAPLSFKEINMICHVKGQVSEDRTCFINFSATCAENVTATGVVSFTLLARKKTASSVSISVQIQNTEQDPTTGKRYINLGDALVVTYQILGGACPYTIYVNWGDGTKEKFVIKCYQDLDGVIKHTYVSKGIFHVNLRIEDASGQSKQSDFDIEIR